MRPPNSNRKVYIILLCFLFATVHCDERFYTKVSRQCGEPNPTSATLQSRVHCAITCLRLGVQCEGFAVTSPDDGSTSSVRCEMYIRLKVCKSANAIWKYTPPRKPVEITLSGGFVTKPKEDIKNVRGEVKRKKQNRGRSPSNRRNSKRMKSN